MRRRFGNFGEVYTNRCDPGIGRNILECLPKFQLAELLKLLQGNTNLSQDFEKQRGTDLPSGVKWNRDTTAIRMIPALMAA
jgi:hypothetical protein